MFFLPPEASGAEACRAMIEDVVDQTGLSRMGWRTVPVEAKELGDQARSTCPHVAQLFVRGPLGMDADALERRLYLARKRVENRAKRDGLEPFYVPSFSSRTVVYKGLMVAGQLDRFYPDLARPEFRTAIAVFHQRYSTNTNPTWNLAHPFRLIAHNGEINTVQGNVLRMKAREPELRGGPWSREELQELRPIVPEGSSDSAALDAALELLIQSGRDPLHALMMVIPEAYKDSPDVDDDLRGFYDYHSALVEPWDGPSAVVLSDGRYAIACLDRNGLRPSRYWITDEGLAIVCSEAGVVAVPPERIVEKGRLGPGKMLAVDVVERRLLHDAEIKREVSTRRPYREWVGDYMLNPGETAPAGVNGQGGRNGANGANGTHAASGSGETESAEAVAAEFTRRQKLFGYGAEDLERILEPMMKEGKEPVGSMGDDTPIAVFSSQPQSLYRYFKQLFAQVTNPPIDPLREKTVMSLDIQIGARGSLLEEQPRAVRLLRYSSPVLSEPQLAWLRNFDDSQFQSTTLHARFAVAEGPEGLEAALEDLGHQAEAAVRRGVPILVVSDKDVGADWAPIPMLLATASVHHRLIRAGIRMQAAVICETGDAREDHHFACLVGYGASLVCPYLSLASLDRLALESETEPALARANYRKAIDGGLLKILSKMGISTLSSYRGAQIFEALGLGKELIDRHFTGTPSRIGGVGLREVAIDVLRFHAEAYGDKAGLRDRGVYHYLSREGEYHAYNPIVFKALHKAVRSDDPAEYKKYADLVDSRPPCNVRDLLAWKKAATPISIDEVEPAEEIARRFCTQAMSHGAISRETHEVLAIAMNRIGGKSNSGEGGEERTRFYEYGEGYEPNRKFWHSPWEPRIGDLANSWIKQVASARFGVTPEYLVAAREIEIKMAQGSKPGEGGQIPGMKVSEEIASIRRSQPGVTLISPPPHHDIYSIEDLSQLIYDLKRINRKARVCVKLVSVVGVGTVAAGVAKGYADSIQISGNDGGTGASPLSSIKHAGLPWELGLAEAQQVLVMNNLRGRVTLRVDGGMKTGRDVVLAALLGAEEYGFGTAALVAAGCVMARRCHLNNCPVGIASQRPDLRKKFPGKPEDVVNFMLYVAQQVRAILAEMGFRKLDDVIGRVDLLHQRTDAAIPKAKVDLSALLADPDPTLQRARRRLQPNNDRPEAELPLDELVWREYEPRLASAQPLEKTYAIDNRERSIGARLSGEIARVHHDRGLPAGSVKLSFHGAAGQSFGAFCNHGMELRLEGEAQDYVGKGMHGGEIVVLPPAAARFKPHESVVMGNTVMYGATGGRLFGAGLAGERFCVRNSGGFALVEGVGDHGCEYMTNGVAIILGASGRNFGAGMSGGVAFLLDLKPERVNPSMVSIETVDHDVDRQLLRAAVERHYKLTLSERAAELLSDWDSALARFSKVMPHPAMEDATAKEQDADSLEARHLRALLDADLVPAAEATAAVESELATV
ncbi:MAG TPA: glutamate synthase large subunit [Planctomycetia bacterium]|nr:glutamate synthase large subunit [Planctomycetia bacterium]